MCNKKFKETSKTLKEIPNPVFEELCSYVGVTGEDEAILRLRYRHSPALTREYVADELGISPSTLDRRIDNILSRITKYGSSYFRSVNV